MNQEVNLLLEPNQKIVNLMLRIAKINSILVIVIGFICLIGWQISLPLLTTFFAGVVGMNPLAAVGFICIGGSLFLQIQNKEGMNSWKFFGSFVLAVITFLIGFITFISFIDLIHVQADQLLFADKLAGNRISPNTIVSFLFIGSALLLLLFSKKYFIRTAQILTLFVATISMIAVIGYAYNTFSFYSVVAFAPMPLSSALTFTIVCLALLASKSNRGITKILTRNTPSSILALRLILITLTLPAILGYFRLFGEQLYLFDTQTGIALLVVGNIILISIVVWINTAVLQKLELENLIIKLELEKKNIKLEINAKNVASKMLELEEEKQEAYDKLSNKEKLMDLFSNAD